jgi:hypothetical protein
MGGIITLSASQPVVSTCKIVAVILFLSIRRPRNPEAIAAKTWLSLKVGATQMWDDQMVKAKNSWSNLNVTATTLIWIFLNIFPPELI